MFNEKLCDLLVLMGAPTEKAREACAEDERWRRMEADIADIKKQLADQRQWWELRFSEVCRQLAEIKLEHVSLVSAVSTLQADMVTVKADIVELKSDVAELKSDVAELKVGMAKVLAWIEKQEA